MCTMVQRASVFTNGKRQCESLAERTSHHTQIISVWYSEPLQWHRHRRCSMQSLGEDCCDRATPVYRWALLEANSCTCCMCLCIRADNPQIGSNHTRQLVFNFGLNLLKKNSWQNRRLQKSNKCIIKKQKLFTNTKTKEEISLSNGQWAGTWTAYKALRSTN